MQSLAIDLATQHTSGSRHLVRVCQVGFCLCDSLHGLKRAFAFPGDLFTSKNKEKGMNGQDTNQLYNPFNKESHKFL